MPFPTHIDNPLKAEDRKKILDALKKADRAEAICEAMGECGMNTEEHKNEVEDIRVLGNQIIKTFFGA